MAKCTDPFDSKPSKKYRYFNQPIEQIPGWKEGEYQVLVHSAGCGLQWHTVQCIDVMICIKKEGTKITAERKRISVFKELPPEGSCAPVECCDSGSGAVAVLGDGGSEKEYVFDYKTKQWVLYDSSYDNTNLSGDHDA